MSKGRGGEEKRGGLKLQEAREQHFHSVLRIQYTSLGFRIWSYLWDLWVEKDVFEVVFYRDVSPFHSVLISTHEYN